MGKRSTIFLWALMLLAYPSYAHAYFDPGAGSLMLQLLLGGTAGIYVVVKLWKQKILKLLGLRKVDETHKGDEASAEAVQGKNRL